jgi:hypothetical protein
MPFGLIRVCKVVTAQESRAATELLDDDNRARWSAGFVSYTGAKTPSGSVVTEVWATREAQARFLARRRESATNSDERSAGHG